jgi:hypothetical protein
MQMSAYDDRVEGKHENHTPDRSHSAAFGSNRNVGNSCHCWFEGSVRKLELRGCVINVPGFLRYGGRVEGIRTTLV